jgi:glycosyltransferase involved in cell wall biosynthesis
MTKLTIYIPVYNQACWCRNFEIYPGVNYIASDNCSTDSSAQILQERGISVIKQEQNLGRLGNWLFCLEHFKNYGEGWMKLLFSGDELSSNCLNEISIYEKLYPAANLLLFNCLVRKDGREVIWGAANLSAEVLSSHEILTRIALNGNCIGALTGMVIGKQLMANMKPKTTLEWAGDLLLAIDLVEHASIVVIPSVVATFNAEGRLHFQKLRDSFLAILEESYAQEVAIRKLSKNNINKAEALRKSLINRHLLRCLMLYKEKPNEILRIIGFTLGQLMWRLVRQRILWAKQSLGLDLKTQKVPHRYLTHESP